MGHLHVGPKIYPPRPMGAQIIMRGPHGHRFAADPVISRLTGQKRGSGFRWWREQMIGAGDLEGSWQPEQKVIGVMGLGDLPGGWRCPYTRAEMDPMIAQAERAVQDPAADPEKVRAVLEQLRECHMQLGGHQTYGSHLARINRAHNAILHRKGKVAPGVVNPATGAPRLADPDKAFWDELRRQGRRMMPDWTDPGRAAGSWWSNNWWKLALAVGGTAFLYGAGQGAFK